MFEKYRMYLAVLGGFLVNITLGGFYSSGSTQIFIVNYMKNYSISPTNVHNGSIHWIPGLVLFGTGASLSLGGFIEKKIGPSLTILIGGWLLSLNTLLTSLTINTYVWVVVIFYGLVSGFGIGIAYGVCFDVPMKWFPKNKGLVIGLVNSGYGISPLLFITIQDLMKMHYIEENFLHHFPILFLITGSIYAMLQLLGAVLVRGPKSQNQETEARPISLSSTSTEIGFWNSFQNEFNLSEMKPHQLIFVTDFWILWMIFALTCFVVTLITSLYLPFSHHLGIPENNPLGNINIISSFIAIFHFLGRIFWGCIIDRIAFKIAMRIICLTSCLFVGTLPLMPLISKICRIYILVLWLAIILFMLSGIFTIFPRICAKLFRTKHFISNYGMVYTGCSVGGTIFSLISQLGFRNTPLKDAEYRNLFIVSSSLLLIAFMLTKLYKGKPVVLTKFGM